MAYASLARIQGLLGRFVIDDDSNPNHTQAESIIDDISDEIDGVLSGLGATVPVTTPAWFLDKLAILNGYGAAATILKSAYPEAQGPGENPAYAFWEARYRKGLQALKDKTEIPLSILGGNSGSSIRPSGYFTRNPDEEEELGDLEGASLFKVSTVF